MIKPNDRLNDKLNDKLKDSKSAAANSCKQLVNTLLPCYFVNTCRSY
jgi:hypothetical protein